MRSVAGSSSIRRNWQPGMPLLFPFMLLTLVGCRHAGLVVEDRFVIPDRVEFAAPEAETWKLSVNRRGRKQSQVVFKRRGGGTQIAVRTAEEKVSSQDIPLDVYANTLFTRRASLRGGVVSVDSMHRILLDEREAIALTGSRFDRPLRWEETLVVIRSQGFLVSLEFLSKEKESPQCAGTFERLLRTLKITLPGEFDPYELGEIPLGAPGRAPRNIYSHDKPPKHPIFRPSGRNLEF